jgi:DNA-binding MarR family transcriptional regulator
VDIPAHRSPSFAESRHLSGLVTLTARLVQEMIGTDLAPYRITYAQAVALVRLWRGDENGMLQGELAIKLSLSRPATTLMLRDLEERGLILRHTDQRDGRRHVVLLTDAGRALEVDVLAVFDKTERLLEAALSKADRPKAFAILRQLLGAVEQARAT